MHFESRFKSLVELFRKSVEAHGARELFGTKTNGRWSWITYAEFSAMVDKLRGGLASLGVGRGDCVAIVANNRVEWAVAAYACYGLGAAFVPMYEAQHPKEWEFIVRDCEAKVLLLANDGILKKARAFVDAVPSLKTVVVIDAGTNGSGQEGQTGQTGQEEHGRVVTYASVLASGNTAPSLDPESSDMATLIYTSGTTGNPKGVILTHGNIASNISAIHEVFPIERQDRSLSFLPWAHVFGQTVELHTLVSMGASMAICESVERIIDNLAEVQPTLLFSVPRIFNRLYTAVQKQLSERPKPIQRMVKEALKITAKERAGERLTLPELALLQVVDGLVFAKVRARFGGHLKYAFSGGAALSPEVAEFIDSLGVTVYEGYGLTETSPIATANVPGARKIGSVGRALPGVTVEVDPATGESRPRPDGKGTRFEGEIIVRGHNVMKGYLKRPEENAAVFTADGGFRTGDMGYVDPQGYLFITGRIKEQYKLENGKYVVPTPLEEALKLSPYVANVMVYGDNRPYNVALVVADVAAVRRWAESEHLRLPNDNPSLLKDDRVRRLFQSEIERRAAAFKAFESVRDFALIDTDFTADNGMLTPSLKLKRRKVVETFGSLLEQMYAKPKSEPRAAAV
jgi:long-chain acyl-CoA synthetase